MRDAAPYHLSSRRHDSNPDYQDMEHLGYMMPNKKNSETTCLFFSPVGASRERDRSVCHRVVEP